MSDSRPVRRGILHALGFQCGPGGTVTAEIPTDDLWTRDACAVFRTDGTGRMNAIGLGFNGWGGKQTHRSDARGARYVAEYAELGSPGPSSSARAGPWRPTATAP